MTIDLEKELLKQNKKVLSARELLRVAEYEKQTHLVSNQILERLGMNETIKRGKSIKEDANKKAAETQKFNQERVFHISQIESLCMKYYLRFLPIKYYKGSVDEHLPYKIGTFELAHGVRLNQETTHIVAPKESFRLEERPKDPLLFYKINEKYFYLVHKWGNDLSITNRLKSLFSNVWVSFFSAWALTTAIGYLLFHGDLDKCRCIHGLIIFGSWLISSFTMMITALTHVNNSHDGAGFYAKNQWDSTFQKN